MAPMLTNASETTPRMMTAFVAFFSAIFMYGVYLYNLKLSKKQGELLTLKEKCFNLSLKQMHK